MRTNNHRTAQLGDLVVAAFDEAAYFSADPAEVSRLATRTVRDMVRRAPRLSRSWLPPARTNCRVDR